LVYVRTRLDSWIGGSACAGIEGVIPGNLSERFLANHGYISGSVFASRNACAVGSSHVKFSCEKKSNLELIAMSQ